MVETVALCVLPTRTTPSPSAPSRGPPAVEGTEDELVLPDVVGDVAALGVDEQPASTSTNKRPVSDGMTLLEGAMVASFAPVAGSPQRRRGPTFRGGCTLNMAAGSTPQSRRSGAGTSRPYIGLCDRPKRLRLRLTPVKKVGNKASEQSPMFWLGEPPKRQSAVNTETLACEERASIAEEEYDRVGHVVGLAQAC
jgi:hypothetical protein